MAITLRHDASAVVPPSNNATRKYGQSLVLQQQQQKYATQQAQQDHMFDAYKMESQNIAQQQRDWQQRDFILNRDRDQNKLQQEQQRAADFAAARSRIDTHAKDMLNNGEIKDPAARNRLSALIAGKTIVMGSGFDETERKEYLDTYNAELAKILAEVPPPKPQPTEQERIDSLPVMDGVRYGKDKDGNPVPVMVQDEETGTWKPYERPSSSRSSGQKGAKGDSGASQRPVTFEEYYGADEDKFQEALNAELQTMQDDFVPDPEGKKKMPTREDALNKMRDDYDFRQQALGKPQYGEPTLAKPYGQALGDAKRGAQNKEKGAQSSYDNLADMNDKLRALENRANSFPKGSKEAKEAWSVYHTERDRIINGGAQPAPEMRSILETPDDLFGVPTAPMPAQVATPPATPTPQATPQSPAAPSQNVSQPAPPQPGQEGGAANYPWLKQPGKLMSENKAGQASSPITIETASVAAKQYEAASQQLQTLQSQAAVMDANIRSLQGRTGRSGVRSTQTNQEIARLKKERQQLNLGIRSAQNTMQASDKSVRGYYDQEVAKQPAVQALAKAGKRPQDFAQAEFQLKNLRMQYPDMSTMPAEAKKQLKEAMAIIQAGR